MVKTCTAGSIPSPDMAPLHHDLTLNDATLQSPAADSFKTVIFLFDDIDKKATKSAGFF